MWSSVVVVRGQLLSRALLMAIFHIVAQINTYGLCFPKNYVDIFSKQVQGFHGNSFHGNHSILVVAMETGSKMALDPIRKNGNMCFWISEIISFNLRYIIKNCHQRSTGASFLTIAPALDLHAKMAIEVTEGGGGGLEEEHSLGASLKTYKWVTSY